jgi:hypothetical protein
MRADRANRRRARPLVSLAAVGMGAFRNGPKIPKLAQRYPAPVGFTLPAFPEIIRHEKD